MLPFLAAARRARLLAASRNRLVTVACLPQQIQQAKGVPNAVAFRSFSTDDAFRGENNRPAYATTTNACLDLFRSAVQGMGTSRLETHLEAAWNENPDHCIRLIFHLGDVRLGGKQEQGLYYRSLIWMYQSHPKSLLKCLDFVPKHTCLKDVLNLLMFALAEELKITGTVAPFHIDHALAKRQRSLTRREILAKVEGNQANEEQTEHLLMKFCEHAISTWPERFSSRSDLRKQRTTVQNFNPFRHKARPWVGEEEWANGEVRQLWIEYVQQKHVAKGKREHEQAKILNERMAAAACEHSQRAGTYKLLFDAVADMFAIGLQNDLKAVNGGLPSDKYSGLIAKWAPTPRGMHDKTTAIVQGIVTRLYPPEESCIAGGTHPDYLSFMTAQYRGDLSRLRRHSQVPEHFVGRGEWGQVNYRRMPSRCRHIFGGKGFRAHDEERYDAHVQAAAEAKAKARTTGKGARGAARVSAGALLPHEIVSRAIKAQGSLNAARSKLQRLRYDLPDAEEQRAAAEAKIALMQSLALEANAQWAEVVDGVREGGTIGGCLAVCDVSGSMEGEPMDVAVALSLLLSEVAEEPWRGLVCTFHSHPRLVRLQNMPVAAPSEADVVCVETAETAVVLGDLSARAHQVMGMSWGYNTDIELVFDRILENAQRGNVPQAAMVQTVFVFSDMEFDEARRSDSEWDTAHQSIQRKYSAAGYLTPRIVYWNLRGDALSIPVTKEEQGTVLVGGFSAGLMKSFLANTLDEFSPMAYLLDTVLENPAWQHLAAHPDDYSAAHQRES